MNKKLVVISIFIGLIITLGILAGPVMSNVEIPQYRIISSTNNIEIRQYEPMITAEVVINDKTRKEAIGEGFRLLADYIFGNNTIQQKILMTAPVQQQINQKIAMTAPVQQQAHGTSWKVNFIMPAEYTIKTLPHPNNERVSLKEIPARRFVAIRFSRRNSDENIIKHQRQLEAYIKEQRLQTTGSPKYAFYNPPWTLPIMRRNEIMIEIQQ